MNDGGLAGSFAVVTGGSRGIGRAVVEALLEGGARVAFTYRRNGAEAAALAAAHAGRASAHFLDLLDLPSIGACFAEATARWGAPDVVVNNAAVGSATVAHYEADPARRDRAILDVNALGALAVCEQALRAFGDREGRAPAKLINIASVGGLAVFPSMTIADNMSKAALVHLTKQLAAEHAHTAVDVFAVCPGATDTAMLRESTLDKLGEIEARRLVARLPKGRLIAPHEIARVVAFLAAPASTVLHGAVIDASMGLGVHPGLVTGGRPLDRDERPRAPALMNDDRPPERPWTYADALRLEALLPLAAPYFEAPNHHDELQFVVVHQCSELWFKLLLHEIDGVCERLEGDAFAPASRLLRRCAQLVATIDAGFALLGTMTARDFVAFRDRLMGRSGFQSAQFREIEVALGRHRPGGVGQAGFTAAERGRIAERLARPDLWTCFVRALRRAGLDAAERSDDPADAERTRRALRELYGGEASPALREASEELVAFDGALLLWRTRHAVMAENAIGAKPGTGDGGVGYLYRQSRGRFFPELVELRTLL